MRKLFADGTLRYDNPWKILDLIRSFPGARWDVAAKVWRVSIRIEDRRRVREICEMIGAECELPAPPESSVAKFAREKGAYPYQVDGVEWLRSGAYRLLADGMGLGKAQSLDTKICTPTGWRKMGALQVGDRVIGSNGLPTTVLGVYPQGKRQLYTVTFSDGVSVETCGEHLWAVRTPLMKSRGKAHVVKSTAELQYDLQDAAGNWRWYIPIVKPVEFEERKVHLHPYVMGYLLANGGLSRGSVYVTIPSCELVTKIQRLLPKEVKLTLRAGSSIDYAITGGSHSNEWQNSVLDAMQYYDLMGCRSEYKFIPSDYKYNTLAIRKQVLQGYLDGDGTSSNGTSIEAGSTSKRLAEDVQELAQSFGGTVTWAEKVPSYTYCGERRKGQRFYRLHLQMPDSREWFTLATKKQQCKARTKYWPSRAITSITPSRIAPCQCIRVDALDSLYVTEHYVVTHNTIQVLLAIEGPTIVVCPSVVKLNWARETETWRSDLRAIVCTGRGSFKCPGEGEVVIVNYEILPDEVTGDLSNVTLVLDEAQYVKNRKAKRTQRVLEIGAKCKKVWGLTGTPLENRPEDLAGVLKATRTFEMIFRTWAKYVELMNGQEKFEWIRGKRTMVGYTWGSPKPLVPELLRRGMLRRTQKQVLKDLPEITITAREVSLDKDLVTEMDEAWDKMGRGLSEMQLPKFEEFSGMRARLAASRIDYLEELVEEYEENEEPVVVFGHHLEPLNKIGARPGWGKITGEVSMDDRQKYIDDFQAGRLKGLAVSIRAGGVGITLTRANKCVFVEQDTVPGRNEQAIKRLARIGQKASHIQVVCLESDHPLDKRVNEILRDKMRTIHLAVENAVEGPAVPLEPPKPPVAEYVQPQVVEPAKDLEVTPEAKQKADEMPSREFYLGGRATFTLEVPEAFATAKGCKPHYTYAITKATIGELYFVSLMSGPDNNSSYTYLGVLSPGSGEIRLTKKSKYTDETWPVKLVRRVVHRIWQGKPEQITAAGFYVHHEGRCGVCGRKLTTPESIKTGIGPICAGKG